MRRTREDVICTTHHGARLAATLHASYDTIGAAHVTRIEDQIVDVVHHRPCDGADQTLAERRPERCNPQEHVDAIEPPQTKQVPAATPVTRDRAERLANQAAASVDDAIEPRTHERRHDDVVAVGSPMIKVLLVFQSLPRRLAHRMRTEHQQSKRI